MELFDVLAYSNDGPLDPLQGDATSYRCQGNKTAVYFSQGGGGEIWAPLLVFFAARPLLQEENCIAGNS